jgi:tetratricopeptide (TPR) repeat protein
MLASSRRPKEDAMIRSAVALAAAVPLLAVLCLPAAAHDGDAKGVLGKVNFPNSCSAAVQPDLNRAIAMLHSFWYSEGLATFKDVRERDPGCALAGWGTASLLMNNPLAGQGASERAARDAQAAVDWARGAGAKTQRERDYIEAVAAYYKDFASRPEGARQRSRSEAYRALAAKYPDDDEAQIFSALYIAGTQQQSDQTYAAYLQAASILEGQFRKYPDHPGVAHYLIHSYDAPPIAAKGLKAAQLYAGIAPAAPHAQHMPSHIFTRVGYWKESVETNQRSFEAALPGNEFDEAYHASDYMVYAYLQLARDQAARSAYERVIKVSGTNPARATAPYAVAAMDARLALERGDWKSAAQLELKPSKFPYVDAITVFARSLGAARSGDAAAADRGVAQLAELHKELALSNNAYWAGEVEVQRISVAAWSAFATGRRDEALALMRQATDLEDRSEKHIISPGRMVPARELLGEMLLETTQPALALKEFEKSHEREPNRFRGYLGAARAAEAVGDKARAASYYAKLLDLAKDADTQRPEVVQARAFVAVR